ncbi:MAG: hypothetical protein QXY39_05175 [Thermofilaceae archaeon]
MDLKEVRMKTFRVRIKKRRTETATTFVWPAWWSEVYDKVDLLAYEDSADLGDVEEYVVGVAEDEVVDRMLALDKEGVVEVVHPEYADEMVQLWKPGRRLGDLVDVKKIKPVGLRKSEDRGRPLKQPPGALKHEAQDLRGHS